MSSRVLHGAVLGAVALLGGCIPLHVPGTGEIEPATGSEAVVFGRVRTFDRGIEIDPWVVEPWELAAEDPIVRLALFQVESRRRRLYPPMGAGGRFAWVLPAGTYLLYHTPTVEPPFNEPLAAFQVAAGPAPIDLGDLDLLVSVDRPVSRELATYTLLSVRASPPTPESAAWFLAGRPGTLPVRQGAFVVDPELHGLFTNWSRSACARILARHGLALRPR
ncbi:MAG TPA: hypothetical protein VFO11_10665 [Candidatus Polarisedimenticolaceae bacterium]|nr:hypothetical protein [Candidatus Polarisedimenticolaceae bacterium]